MILVLRPDLSIVKAHLHTQNAVHSLIQAVQKFGLNRQADRQAEKSEW